MSAWLGLLAMTMGGQVAEPPPPAVAVVVVTLDELRQGQARYGRVMVESLGGRWGAFRYVAPAIEASAFDSCQDERLPDRIDHCIRYYVSRAERAAEGAPTVAVVLDDDNQVPPRRGGELRVYCVGQGGAVSDAAAQATWLWPGAARMHGMNDLNRDNDALAACIRAAAAET